MSVLGIAVALLGIVAMSALVVCAAARSRKRYERSQGVYSYKLIAVVKPDAVEEPTSADEPMVTLTWPAVPGATSYKVYRSGGSDD